jgi:hypothetical protein
VTTNPSRCKLGSRSLLAFLFKSRGN